MFTKNLFQRLRLGVFTLTILCVSSCTHYSTVQLDNSASTYNENISNSKLFIIHNSTNSEEYVLTTPKFENDILSGTLIEGFPGRKPEPHDKQFRKKHMTAYNAENIIHIYTKIKGFELGAVSIGLDKVKIIEVHKLDITASIISTITGVIIIPVGAIVGFLAIACSCPEVSSSDGVSETSHGSLFPGAILNSLKRDDHLVLKNPLLDKDGSLSLKIANNQKETQYIDELEVLQVSHKGYQELAINQNDELIAFRNPQSFRSVKNYKNKDVAHAMLQQDNISYNFDDENAKKLNEVVLTFDKSTLSNHPALIINGKQSHWLDTVSTLMLSQAGKYQEKWTEKNDDMSPKKWKKSNQKRGLSLNVYVKQNNKWKYSGTFHDVGTFSKRTLLMDLDLSGVTTSTVEVKLESAFKIWEIDYVGLTDDWTTDLEKTPLKLNQAVNQDGEDLTTLVASNDKNEVKQTEGSFIQISATPQKVEESTLVLHGAGYYHKHSDFDNNINWAFFAKFKQKMGLNDVSKALYLYMNTVQ